LAAGLLLPLLSKSALLALLTGGLLAAAIFLVLELFVVAFVSHCEYSLNGPRLLCLAQQGGSTNRSDSRTSFATNRSAQQKGRRSFDQRP